ncbi:MAG TPA: glutathione S-transferase N-terminal domain-containing protein [Burkholderiales bacterium]|nr:glutathione S-transferase N-terminal domain-containing protein [Burkholderiales bacterium]
MKLHTFVGSPNSHKVQAVVGHLGLEIQVEYHDFVGGDLRTADYLALNPNGMVPLLVRTAPLSWRFRRAARRAVEIDLELVEDWDALVRVEPFWLREQSDAN